MTSSDDVLMIFCKFVFIYMKMIIYVNVFEVLCGADVLSYLNKDVFYSLCTSIVEIWGLIGEEKLTISSR